MSEPIVIDDGPPYPFVELSGVTAGPSGRFSINFASSFGGSGKHFARTWLGYRAIDISSGSVTRAHREPQGCGTVNITVVRYKDQIVLGGYHMSLKDDRGGLLILDSDIDLVRYQKDPRFLVDPMEEQGYRLKLYSLSFPDVDTEPDERFSSRGKICLKDEFGQQC